MIYDPKRKIEKVLTDTDIREGRIYLEKISVETNLINFLKPYLRRKANDNEELNVELKIRNDGTSPIVQLKLIGHSYAVCDFQLIQKEFGLKVGDYVQFVPVFNKIVFDEVDKPITMWFMFQRTSKGQTNKEK